jgi:hypothetical protein
MHNLYDLCFRPNATPAQIRWGIVRYVSFQLGWIAWNSSMSGRLLVRLVIAATLRGSYPP